MSMTTTARAARVEYRAPEVRAQMRGDTLSGYAAVFNRRARIRGGYEELAPTAFNEALGRGADVRALVNHDPSQLLARTSAGTLRLHTDARGLAFELDLPDTTYARDVRELVRRGDLDGASFGFLPGKDSLYRASDGSQVRTHLSVAELLDVSVVTFPAYQGTSVALRTPRPLAVVGRSQPLDRRTQMLVIRHRVRTEAERRSQVIRAQHRALMAAHQHIQPRRNHR